MNSKPEWPVLILKIEGLTPIQSGGSHRGETLRGYKYTAWRFRRCIERLLRRTQDVHR
jgi:hypothetical protein